MVYWTKCEHRTFVSYCSNKLCIYCISINYWARFGIARSIW